MNLFLALFWLVCAAVLLAYEQFIGRVPFRICLSGYSFSYAWLMLALVLYNLRRWRSHRTYRAMQRAAEIAGANQKWKERRHSAAPAGPPDPNFNFSDEPPPPSRHDFTERPPPTT